MIKISAKGENSKDNNQVTLQTSDNVHSITILPKSMGCVSRTNGGELLFLALASCYCNDIYREAAKLNIKVEGDFGTEGEPAKIVTYKVNVFDQASEGGIRELVVSACLSGTGLSSPP
jgi:organic hydroperoxide reductase OsmC/OhrA